jgi:hypothetical protein
MHKKEQRMSESQLAELASQIRTLKKPAAALTLAWDMARWDLIEEFMVAAPVEAIIAMVKDGSIPKRGGLERSPLYIAAMNDLAHLVKPLVDAGCNVNQRVVYDMSPLSHALTQGNKQKDSSMVRALLDSGARGSDHGDVMIWAAQCAHVHNVAELLNRGYDVNKRCRTTGQTPLVAAIWELVMDEKAHDAEKTIRLLLQKGADPNKTSRSQSDPDTFETPYGVLTSLHLGPPIRASRKHEAEGKDELIAEPTPEQEKDFAGVLAAHGVTLPEEPTTRSAGRAPRRVDVKGIIALMREKGLDQDAPASRPPKKHNALSM